MGNGAVRQVCGWAGVKVGVGGGIFGRLGGLGVGVNHC